MIEAAIVIQLLLVVMFGLLEASRLMLVYNTLTNAARAGTRYAIVHGNNRQGGAPGDLAGPSGPDQANTSNVAEIVRRMTRAAALPDAAVHVNTGKDDPPMYPEGRNDVGAKVYIKVSYEFSPIVPAIWPKVNVVTTSEGTICY